MACSGSPAGAGRLPPFSSATGSGGASADQTAGMRMEEAAARLAPLFTRRGYAFLYPFRRGQGGSADAGPFMRDVLAREEREHGTDARQRLQDVLLETEQLDDVLAALAFLKRAPGIDPARLAIVEHSFGGQLSLVAAREPTLRATVTFAAAAGSWQRSAEVRRALGDAVRHAHCPILLVQWDNDFSTEPSRALGQEAHPGGPARRVVLYPPVGTTPEKGHNGLYLDIAHWEPDVFRWLDASLAG